MEENADLQVIGFRIYLEKVLGWTDGAGGDWEGPTPNTAWGCM